MARSRYIDPLLFARRVPPNLPEHEHHRCIAEAIRAAIFASAGVVQIHRACSGPECMKIMRLGGWKIDSGSDGRMDKVYCCNRCREKAWKLSQRRRRKIRQRL